MRSFLSHFVPGLILWTLMEYLLHRFVFHRFRGILGSFHHEHHASPRALKYLFVRPGYALAASAVFASVIFAVTGSPLRTLYLMSGVWAGFIYYESVHYRAHFTAAEGRLIRRQRRAHFRHHFHDSRRSFGVTSPLWDYVFRTTSSA